MIKLDIYQIDRPDADWEFSVKVHWITWRDFAICATNEKFKEWLDAASNTIVKLHEFLDGWIDVKDLVVEYDKFTDELDKQHKNLEGNL